MILFYKYNIFLKYYVQIGNIALAHDTGDSDLRITTMELTHTGHL